MWYSSFISKQRILLLQNKTSSFIHSAFHATTYLFDLLSSYSDIIQSSKLDIHTDTLSLAHMDSFWFPKLSVALIRMMFMPYYVYAAEDTWKVVVFHTEIQHYFLTYNSEERTESQATKYFYKRIWKITCSSSTEKVNHYVAMRSRCETVFHWN